MTAVFPDTIAVPKSSVVYLKVQDGEPGFNPKKTFYRAKPDATKPFKDSSAASKLWQAHHDKNNNNMMYFSDPATQQTVWVLPDLELGAATATATPTTGATSSTAADDIKRKIQEQLAAKMAGLRPASNTTTTMSSSATNPPTADSATDNNNANNTSTTSTARPPLAIPSTSGNSNNNNNLSTSTPNASPIDVVSRTPRSTTAVTANNNNNNNNATAGGSWRDRIAERRGKSPSTPSQQGLATPSSSNGAGGAGPLRSASPFDLQNSNNQQQQQQNVTDKTTTVSANTSEQGRYAERRQQLSSSASSQQQEPNDQTASPRNNEEQPQQKNTSSNASPRTGSVVTFANNSNPQQQQQQQEAAVVEQYELEAETARTKAAKLEMQVQQRRLLQAQQEEAHHRELEETQEKRKQLEARRLQMEMERVQLLSDKKTRQDQILASFQRGDPEEIRARAQARLDEARQEAKKQFFSQVRDRDVQASSSPRARNNNDDVLPPVDVSDVEEEVKKRVVDYGKNFVYSGQVKKSNPDVRHGKGQMQYGPRDEDSGRHTTYEGEWRNHVKNGWGAMNLPTSMYEGDWLNDKLHGRGTLRTRVMQANAPFQKGVAHGNGAVVQIRGQGTFQGPLRNNKGGETGHLRVEQQQQQNANKTKINVDANNNNNNSTSRSSVAATQTLQQIKDHPLGAIDIEWQWTDPAVAGTGEACATFADGNVYVGSIKNYTLSGPGRLTFASTGDEYLGDFLNNVMHGKGLYRFALDGSIYEGEMKEGSFNGLGTFAAPSFLYEGEWRDGQMHGRGRIKYENGDVWEGIFENHRRSEGRYAFSTVFALEEAVAIQ